MIKLKHIEQAVENLKNQDLSPNILKDILFNLFLFDTEFPHHNTNELIILKAKEVFHFPNLIPEIEEEIDNYKKILYITSNSGEGIIIYQAIE